MRCEHEGEADHTYVGEPAGQIEQALRPGSPGVDEDEPVDAEGQHAAAAQREQRQTTCHNPTLTAGPGDGDTDQYNEGKRQYAPTFGLVHFVIQFSYRTSLDAAPTTRRSSTCRPRS